MEQIERRQISSEKRLEKTYAHLKDGQVISPVESSGSSKDSAVASASGVTSANVKQEGDNAMVRKVHVICLSCK